MSDDNVVTDLATLDIRPGDLVYVCRSYSKVGRRLYVTKVERDPDGLFLWLFGHQVGAKSNIASHDTVARGVMTGWTIKVLRRDSEAAPGTKAGAELAAGDHVKIGGLLVTVTETSQYTGAPNVLVKGHRTNGRYFVAIVHPAQRITLRERSAQA